MFKNGNLVRLIWSSSERMSKIYEDFKLFIFILSWMKLLEIKQYLYNINRHVCGKFRLQGSEREQDINLIIGGLKWVQKS